MRIPLDLIMPEQEVILEAPQEFSAVPVLLAAAVVIVAAILIMKAVKKKK